MLKKRLKPILLVTITSMAFSASAASYPDQPIRVIVPYSPGSSGDIVFRHLQPLLTEELGQTIIVEYKSGAGGNIGAQFVARAQPDGYTLMLGATNNFVINQFLYKDMGYDPFVDFEPVGKVAQVPAFVYVNAEVPAKNFADFKNYAKANPGTLNYGTPGAGTTPALSGWMLSQAVEGKMTEISYRGSPPGVQALLANEIQVYVGGYGIASSHLASGKLNVLAVALPERFSELPNVPTTKEVGLENAVVSNWWALAAPAKTEPAVIARLEKALQNVLANKELQKSLVTQGFVVDTGVTEDMKKAMTIEAPYWQDVIQKANVKVN